jgi:hypothetical protein
MVRTYFKAALQAPDGLPVVAEMLSNGAPMNLKIVAQALRTYFSQPGSMTMLSESGSAIFTATLSSDFIRGAGTRVLDRLAEEYSKNRSVVTDTIVAYCLLELKDRGLKLDHVSYDALKAGFQREDLILQVPGLGSVEPAEMNPATGKVPSLLASGRKTIGGNVKRS